jgi:hypothetical protein
VSVRSENPVLTRPHPACFQGGGSAVARDRAADIRRPPQSMSKFCVPFWGGTQAKALTFNSDGSEPTLARFRVSPNRHTRQRLPRLPYSHIYVTPPNAKAYIAHHPTSKAKEMDEYPHPPTCSGGNPVRPAHRSSLSPASLSLHTLPRAVPMFQVELGTSGRPDLPGECLWYTTPKTSRRTKTV